MIFHYFHEVQQTVQNSKWKPKKPKFRYLQGNVHYTTRMYLHLFVPRPSSKMPQSFLPHMLDALETEPEIANPGVEGV